MGKLKLRGFKLVPGGSTAASIKIWATSLWFLHTLESNVWSPDPVQLRELNCGAPLLHLQFSLLRMCACLDSICDDVRWETSLSPLKGTFEWEYGAKHAPTQRYKGLSCEKSILLWWGRKKHCVYLRPQASQSLKSIINVTYWKMKSWEPFNCTIT